VSAPDHPVHPPTLRIVRGVPTPEELAALVAVLAAAGEGGGEPSGGPEGAVSQWAPPSRLMRPAVVPSGWWESSLPR
jgi:acyl-CoA carboxylase epsilon subunit